MVATPKWLAGARRRWRSLARPSAPTAPVRNSALDGLRGVAIVLVVLSHSWLILTTTDLEIHPALLNLLRSGNVAVSIFLVVSGFLLTRSLLADIGPRRGPDGAVRLAPAHHPWRALARRWIRLSAQVYPLALVILVVSVLDPTDILPLAQTRDSLFRVVTYSWNTYLQSSSILARPDLGHLWYTSVYLQVAVVLVVLVRVLGRRRWALLLALTVALVLVTAWRSYALVTEGEALTLLRTTARADGMLWGALGATAWPWLARAKEAAGALTATGLLGLTGLVLSIGYSDAYLRWAGVATNMFTLFVIVGVVLAPTSTGARLLGNRLLALLGRHSLATYIWHYPVFWAVARHTTAWTEPPRVAVSLVVVAVLVAVTTRWVERPLAALLERLLARVPDRGRPALPEVSPAVDAGQPSPAPAEPARR